MTEVSKILEYQLSHSIDGLIPTVCQDRCEDFENLHNHDEDNLTETDESSQRNVSLTSLSDDKLFNSDEIVGLDEIAELLSKGYEDIRASNPDIWSIEEETNEFLKLMN